MPVVHENVGTSISGAKGVSAQMAGNSAEQSLISPVLYPYVFKVESNSMAPPRGIIERTVKSNRILAAF
ncbi:unnamed protein product [marine sediment metagenome]|uniref:Uncharacterized protein n=1 Tax=marine sediment metagenome TaxID=412755 RepID=X1JK36_9ZZZZ